MAAFPLRPLRAASLSVVLVVGGACAEAPGPDLIDEARAPLQSQGITKNGLSRSGLLANGVADHPDGAAALVGTGLHGRRFASANAAATTEFLSYAASCALPSGTSAEVVVNDASVRLDGELGLAPAWRDAPCDEACQEWVTACLLARTNYWGDDVEVSLRGPHPQLTAGWFVRQAYSQQEGAFYGNLFAPRPALYACAGDMFDSAGGGSTIALLQHRICADEAFEACPMTIVGPCRDFLLPPYLETDERACEVQASPSRAFERCRPALGTPAFAADARPYTAVVTTFLDPLTPPWWVVE